MFVLRKCDILIIDGKAYAYDEKKQAMVCIPFHDDCGNVITPQLGSGDDPK
jgi:hypothetical protein